LTPVDTFLFFRNAIIPLVSRNTPGRYTPNISRAITIIIGFPEVRMLAR